MGKTLLYASLAALAFFIMLSAAFAILFFIKDSEKRALDSELSRTRGELQGARDALEERDALLAQKNALITGQASNISALSADLEDKRDWIRSLEQELARTQSELEEAENALQEAEEDIAALKDETLEMESRIDESIAWFTGNAELPSTLKADRFISKVEDGCLDGQTLKLGCVSYLMDADLGFTYQFDPGGDTLYSIEDIIERRGGDCEDYALFFKALLNRFDGMELEAWEKGSGRYELYKDYKENVIWYLDETDKKALDGKDLNPYAVCYYYGYYGEVRIGHCIIMVTDKVIMSPEDITSQNLAGAQLFEPQTGEYFGRIGSEFGVCMDGQEGCEEGFGNLVFIITDDDLFEFSEGGWNYYGGYLERAQAIVDELDAIST
ncbi:MAG: hypothetical protein AB1295_00055 [Candidatus Micrarchaeota archaeon]